MDRETANAIARLEERVNRATTSAGAEPVRPAIGGGGGSASIKVTNVSALPAIPTDKFTLVRLEDDTVYWAVPGDLNWHPLGGKFGLTDGSVGSTAP